MLLFVVLYHWEQKNEVVSNDTVLMKHYIALRLSFRTNTQQEIYLKSAEDNGLLQSPIILMAIADGYAKAKNILALDYYEKFLECANTTQYKIPAIFLSNMLQFFIKKNLNFQVLKLMDHMVKNKIWIGCRALHEFFSYISKTDSLAIMHWYQRLNTQLSQATYISIFLKLTEIGQIIFANQVLVNMKKVGFVPPAPLISNMINSMIHYSSIKDIFAFLNLIVELNNPMTSESFDLLIIKFAEVGHLSRSFEVYYRLVDTYNKRGDVAVKPSVQTFINLILACALNNSIENITPVLRDAMNQFKHIVANLAILRKFTTDLLIYFDRMDVIPQVEAIFKNTLVQTTVLPSNNQFKFSPAFFSERRINDLNPSDTEQQKVTFRPVKASVRKLRRAN